MKLNQRWMEVRTGHSRAASLPGCSCGKKIYYSKEAGIKGLFIKISPEARWLYSS
jgi:hypothetical protein